MPQIINTPINFTPWQVVELAEAATPPPEAESEQPPEQPVLDAAAMAALVAALALLLLAGGPDMHLSVGQKLVDAGFRPDIATAVAGMVKNPAGVKVPNGPSNVARRQTLLTNFADTGRYLISAAQRVTTAVRDGTPLPTAIRDEAANARAHLAATTSRMSAARDIDQQATATGATRFRWKAIKDARTDPECMRLDGREFDVAKPPTAAVPARSTPTAGAPPCPSPAPTSQRS